MQLIVNGTHNRAAPDLSANTVHHMVELLVRDHGYRYIMKDRNIISITNQ